MNTLSRVTEKLTEYLSYLGMIGVLAMMLHIGADIIGRTVFEVSVPATLEMVTRYYMLMLVLLPLPWVEQKRFMIMVEAFSGVFGKLGLRLVDVLVSLVCVVVYWVLAVSTWEKAMEQYDVGAYLVALDTQIIVWPGYFTLPFGFGLAALVCLVRIPVLLFPPSAAKAG
ncbi:MAG TPA: TRAP transporter small permease subunit [Marinobacter sp.]|nr:TRAP transporter small permease subunit [Marinobacter sp.]